MWEVLHGRTAAAYQDDFNRLTGLGYRPIHVAGYEEGGVAKFTAIFINQSGVNWATHHGINSSQHTDFDSQYPDFQKSMGNGFSLGGESRFAAIWTDQIISETDFRSYSEMTSASFQSAFDSNFGAGLRLLYLDGELRSASGTWFAGSLPGTTAMAVQKSDGTNIVAVINRRRFPQDRNDTYYNDLQTQLDGAHKLVTSWPMADVRDRPIPIPTVRTVPSDDSLQYRFQSVPGHVYFSNGAKTSAIGSPTPLQWRAMDWRRSSD